MKTKIVYVLVSTVQDYYYEQLLISVYSLRQHNSDAVVEVVCDKETYSSLIDNRKAIFDYVDNVIAIDTPNWKNVQKSRYIKTNLRQIIKGDYLFIDTDTIIMHSLSEIDAWTMDIGATFDGHIEKPISLEGSSDSEVWIKGTANEANVNVLGMLHYNSGVFYVKDTKIAHELYSRWYAKYQEISKKGVIVDQLPLLLVNNEMGNIIKPIERVWNCQIIVQQGMNIMKDAKIIHYFAQKNRYEITSPWILEELKYRGQITSRIQTIVNEPQKSFCLKYRVIRGKEVDFIDTPIYMIYCDCRCFFKLLLIESTVYTKIKSWLKKIYFCTKDVETNK